MPRNHGPFFRIGRFRIFVAFSHETDQFIAARMIVLITLQFVEIPTDMRFYSNLRRYATIWIKMYAVGQCIMPDSNVKPASAWKFRDKLSNFSRLKPLIVRNDLLRSVLSATMTNHSGEPVIRKFSQRAFIQGRMRNWIQSDRSVSIPMWCKDINSKISSFRQSQFLEDHRFRIEQERPALVRSAKVISFHLPSPPFPSAALFRWKFGGFDQMATFRPHRTFRPFHQVLNLSDIGIAKFVTSSAVSRLLKMER
jgi:hypothetical protein